MLEHRFRDNNLYSQLVDNISRTRLNFIFYKAKQDEKVGFDSSMCGCALRKTYGLPRACLISKKVKLDIPIRMDEVCTHWKMVKFGDNGVMKDGKSNIFILTE